jgi:maltooligosyltrehalose trehalohydrolase
VRKFVIDNAEMWLRDYHCDGLRLDAVHAIRDDSALHILEESTERIGALGAHLGRSFVTIAESDLNDPRLVRGRESGGFGLDAVYADEFHHAIHAVLTRETTGYYEDFGSMALLAKAVRDAWVYTGEYSRHRRRVHGRRTVGVSGQRFVVFLQNHDQVGNRAIGDRIGSSVSPGSVKVGAALVILSNFVPMIFQGEEWGRARHSCTSPITAMSILRGLSP